MTVAATVTALQTLHATITGVSSAPTVMPASLNNAELPVCLTFPGEGGWKHNSMDGAMLQQRRRYVVKVYVAPIPLGQGLDEGYQLSLPMLQAFGEKYMGVTTLSGAIAHLGTLESGLLATDLGVGIIPFAGIDYHGFTYFVDIIEKTAVP